MCTTVYFFKCVLMCLLHLLCFVFKSMNSNLLETVMCTTVYFFECVLMCLLHLLCFVFKSMTCKLIVFAEMGYVLMMMQWCVADWNMCRFNL